MKRKIVSLLLGTVMAVCLVACSSEPVEVEASLEIVEGITYVDYSNLEIEAVELTEVTEEDIESTLQGVIDNYTTSSVVSYRSVRDGDVVNVDYTGYVDDEVVDAWSDVGADIAVGAGLFVEGFEDGLIGMNVGDTVELDVTVPDDYWIEEYRGAELTFEIEVNTISILTIPEMTDEFVQEITTYSSTVDEFKEEIILYLEEEYEAQQTEEQVELIWAAITEGTVVAEYPEAYIQEQVDYTVEMYTAQVEYYYSITFEEYLETIEMTMEEFEESARQTAQDNYDISVTVLYIAEQEGIEPIFAEYQLEIDSIVEEYGYSTEEEFYASMNMTRTDLELEICTDVVLNWLSDNITYIDAAE